MEGTLSPADVAVLTGNNGRNNDGFGGDFGAWWIIIIIILFGGWGRNGFGGFGGNSGSTSVYEGYVLGNDFSQLSKQISDTYNMTDRKFDAITNGLCSLGYQELQNINGVNTNLFNGFANVTNAITTNGYETRNAITQDTVANMQNANAIQSQIASCCCDIKGIAKDTRYENLQNINTLNNNINAGFVGIQNSMCMNTKDIISSQENGTRAILDAITQNRIEDKNAQIAAQQNEINSLRLAASQSAQNEYLLNSLRNGCPVNARLYRNEPVPVQYVATGCNCNQCCGCNM